MSTKFNQSFKSESVKKVLSRSKHTTVGQVAAALGVAKSSLYRWVENAKDQELEARPLQVNGIEQEKSPNDWSLEERFDIVIRCDSLSLEQVNTACRESGIYPHHLEQWKNNFLIGAAPKMTAEERAERKILKQENDALRRELRRKEKALAEVAALLILQKKNQKIWEREEGNLL
jgi:transposase